MGTHWCRPTEALHIAYMVEFLAQLVLSEFSQTGFSLIVLVKRKLKHQTFITRKFESKLIIKHITFTCLCDLLYFSMQFFRRKTGNFPSHFGAKHRFLVLVRTASARRFLRAPRFYVLNWNKRKSTLL